MKNFFKLWLYILVATLVSPTFAQNVKPNSNTFSGGTFYSPNYNYGAASNISPLRVIYGTTTAGIGTVTLTFGYFTTPDGRQVTPFGPNVTTFPPITIDAGVNQETVTPTSASCSTPGVINTCQITATFSYIHGVGATITSADQGIQEAINDAASQNGGQVYWTIDPGVVTLSTSALSTNLGAIAIPTRSIVLGSTARVDTTITGCTGGWSLGYSSGTEFTAANTTLTLGTTTDTSTFALPYMFNASATIPVAHCTTADATAGTLHAKIWGYKLVVPNS